MMSMPTFDPIRMLESIGPIVVIKALQDHSSTAVGYLNETIQNIPIDRPLCSKLRMIVAIKENRPLDAIKIVMERPVAAEDEYEIMVLLECAFSIMPAADVNANEGVFKVPFLYPHRLKPQNARSVASQTCITGVPKKHFTVEDVQKLCRYFEQFRGIFSPEQITAIASEIGATEQKIKIWFRNRNTWETSPTDDKCAES